MKRYVQTVRPNRTLPLLTLLFVFALAACDTALVSESAVEGATTDAAAKAEVQSRVVPIVFMPAGPVGGGVLDPGTTYPPGPGSYSKLLRNKNWVQYELHTTGLPPGAYTVWIIVFNDPENCAASPCTDVDLFFNTEAVDGSALWSAGGIVGSGGVGNFKARVHTGWIPDGEDQIALPGSGLQDPFGAEIHLIVKYHGPASDDPDVLYDQTHTLLGSCFDGANAFDFGEFGIHCFDPLAVIHTP